MTESLKNTLHRKGQWNNIQEKEKDTNAITWMNLKKFMLSERSEAQKDH